MCIRDSNVIDADFSGVDLRQTNITREQLVRAGSLHGAQYQGDESLRLRLLRGLPPRKRRS